MTHLKHNNLNIKGSQSELMHNSIAAAATTLAFLDQKHFIKNISSSLITDWDY